jgi:hypothetical protein
VILKYKMKQYKYKIFNISPTDKQGEVGDTAYISSTKTYLVRIENGWKKCKPNEHHPQFKSEVQLNELGKWVSDSMRRKERRNNQHSGESVLYYYLTFQMCP